MPPATSAACTMAVTEPLPFVPATWMEVNARSGCPRASQSRAIFSRPSLIPKVSCANSRSSTSARSIFRLKTAATGAGELLHAGGCAFSRKVNRRFGAHEPQRARDDRFQFPPIDHQVEHAVLDQELAALEALRQLLPDRLLDDARAREADERLGFGEVEVAQH